jgi:UDP-N-acetylglucosamine 2-epimerase (non-hydrolysing)
MNNVMIVIGTRPELIKLAPVIDECERAGLRTTVVFSGQHIELLEQAAQFFGIEADAHCRLDRAGGRLNDLLAALLSALGPLVDTHKPDAIIGQGDTTTALASGLTAFHHRIPFGHVEAGLRSHQLDSPFPEEGNRRLLSRVSTWNFAPTDRAAQALSAEGIRANDIVVTGNTVVDSVRYVADRAEPPESLKLGGRPLAIVTMHRRENFGDNAETMLGVLDECFRDHPEWQFVFIKHLNPAIRASVEQCIQARENVTVIEPVDYGEMIALLERSALALTDSGGLQEEAAALDVPVLVLRDNTERTEGIHAGCAMIGTTRPSVLRKRIRLLLGSAKRRAQMSQRPCPYGDGLAARRIARTLAEDLHRLSVDGSQPGSDTSHLAAKPQGAQR